MAQAPDPSAATSRSPAHANPRGARGRLTKGFSTAPSFAERAFALQAQGLAVPDYPTFELNAVDSFIEIHGDGSVLVKIGKINNGQGTPTSWAMMAAEELDVPLSKVDVRFGDTAGTPDQGGTGGSNGVSSVYGPLRQIGRAHV